MSNYLRQSEEDIILDEIEDMNETEINESKNLNKSRWDSKYNNYHNLETLDEHEQAEVENSKISSELYEHEN